MPKAVQIRKPALKLKPSFRASLQSDGTLELLVYEEIGENWWTGGGVTAKTVKQQIEQASNYTGISVRINSPGGDAFEGVAIYNVLRATKVPIQVFVDGIAASAASVIAMAGDSITMGYGAMLMIHNAFCSCVGFADDMRKMADTLDRVSVTIGEVYVARTGQSAAEVKALMDAETWLGGEQALELGFCTAVGEADADSEASMALARTFKSLAHMRHVPAALKPKADTADGDDPCTCPCGPCQDADCANCDCNGCESTECGCDGCNCGSEGVEDDDEMDNATNLTQYEARLRLL